MLRLAGIKVLHDVSVPLRDGVHLSADVYLPAGEQPHPVVLIRTPYDNTRLMDMAFWWAEHGYACVAQDVRGRYDSGGSFIAWENETSDGVDTLEWIAAQPWCDGNIGMSGASYMGQVQWQAAFAGTPQLKAIAPRVIGDNLWRSPHYEGGAFGLGVNALWGWRTVARTMQPIEHFDWATLLRTLPLSDLPRASGKHHPGFTKWLTHEAYDDYWRSFAVDEHYSKIAVPALQVGGWYDMYAAGMLRNFNGMRMHGARESARLGQRIVIGPWTHLQAAIDPPGSTNAGDRDFGSVSLLDTRAIELDWWDRWLRGTKNESQAEAPIRLFVMGANYWRDEAEWPLYGTRWTPFYLHSSGSANSLHGDGLLGTDEPTSEPADQFVYDPMTPVPTRGGPNCCSPNVLPWGAFDQSSLEARHDVLVYSTAPLESDLEVTGPIAVHLFAVTDGPDTDFTAKLVDVDANGLAWNLCDGIVRARYRDSTEPTMLQPGEVYEYVIDCSVTSNLFKAGHRIRLEISSSNFPRFDRNLNTGNPIADDASPRIAHQTVLHDAEHPSRIVLPVIPATR